MAIRYRTVSDHERPVVDFKNSPSLTHQEFADESDINHIIKRYQSTGILIDPLKVNHERKPMFGDYSDVPDLAKAYDLVAEAQMNFQALPFKVRRRFANPVEFYDFVLDPEHRQECERLGLLAKPIIEKAAEAAIPEPQTKAAKPSEAKA